MRTDFLWVAFATVAIIAICAAVKPQPGDKPLTAKHRRAPMPVIPPLPASSYPDALSPEGREIVAGAEALLADPLQCYLDLGDGA